MSVEKKLKVIFMGTPSFALPTLEALLNHPQIEVIGVLTQPDRPSGRGQKLQHPPVKDLALRHQLVVFQPERLRKDETVLKWLREQQADFFVTAAFGQILPQVVLEMPKYGVVNIHGSLLPQYRGANPVQWAIINNAAETGITTMLTALEVDAGDMLLRRALAIEPNESAGELLIRLSVLGGEMIVESLLGLATGQIKPEPQDHTQSTHAPKLNKENAVIDWQQSAQVVHNKIRGQNPWPGAVLEAVLPSGEKIQLKIHQSLIHESPDVAVVSKMPGQISYHDKKGLWVQCGDRPLLVSIIQPPGKPKMKASDWANGVFKT